ncbi:sulfotransferase [Clostridium sp.]|uniref:sulfotransferase n=1 Tax=Clostridium sp. TaxID=1506 RepID=UPI003463C26A
MGKKVSVVTCASYGGTGSSAITDLLKEFDNVNSLGDFEFSICHEVDGISDLQHHLVDDFHRLKNDEAIYRFKKLCGHIEKDYNKYFNNKFSEITEEYIESLIDVEWQGYWHQHNYRYNKLLAYMIYTFPSKIQRKLNSIFNKNRKYEFVAYTKKSPMCLAYPKEDFLDKTRNYTDKLLSEIDNNYKYLALDQLVSPFNVKRYLNYYSDIKVIVVDRDPRDLYILNKVYWKEGWIPSENVDTYIKWFKTLRAHLNYEKDDERIIRINFEDLIYNYNNTLEKIMNFLNLDLSNHTRPKKFLNPEISIKNCGLFKNYSELQNDIRKIESELKEFCYLK